MINDGFEYFPSILQITDGLTAVFISNLKVFK